MRKIILLLTLSIIVLLFNSCDPSENNSSDSNFSENFGAAVSRDFIGQVVDADNHPIQGVTIKIGTSSVQTDINGVFIINDASVHEKFAYITAKKTGYVDGSRSMVPTSGKNNVRIMLLQDTPLQTIQSGVTTEVSIYSGTKVAFDGAFMDENGTPYSGTVAVSMFHLTPSDENIDKLMPGMLYAQTQDNKEAVLETFGMLHVELKGSNGQKLQIATGHTAQITMRIDDTQLASCPTTIPLWHFDEENGYWKQEGSATKNGNYYVGNVSHFSWWNCDMPNSSILLTFNFVDEMGNKLSNLNVIILNPDGYHATGFTDNNGQLSGMLPANQNFSLNLYNNNIGVCSPNGIYYSVSIGSFNADTVLPNFVINNQNYAISSSNVVGTLVRCDNTNVTNGYVLLNRSNDFSILPVIDGTFSFNQFFCTNDTHFTIKGVDFDNLQQTDSVNYNFISPITNINNLKACYDISEFVTYSFDGVDYFHTLILPQTIANGFYTIRSQNSDGTTSRIEITGNPTLPGLYSVGDFDLWVQRGNTTYHCSNLFSGNTVKFWLNHFGVVGDYIDINFNGNFRTGVNGVDLHNISGLVHVKRYN